MGGRFGDGPVIPEDVSVRFKENWHRKAMALTLAGGATGLWSLDMSRRVREALAPTDYTRFAYYEKWIAALADILVETGAVSREEIAGGVAEEHPLHPKALRGDAVAMVLAQGGPADRPSDVQPRFAPGEAVRTLRPAENRLLEGGHTRLPVYASGVEGRVLRYHGTHVLPDSNAHGLGEAPEPLYAVVFPAAALWAHPEHPRDEVVLDLWQSYLEPA